MGEEWRPVIDFEGLYEVSDWGRVRRIGRGRGAQVGRILAQRPHAAGYVTIALHNKKMYHRLAHRLVVEAFLGKIPVTMEVNHKDGDKANNYIENLEIVTRSQNICHAIRNGLIPLLGEDNHKAKLSEQEVREIRAIHASGAKGYKRLARIYNVDPGTIRHIVKRHTWRHLEDNGHS